MKSRHFLLFLFPVLLLGCSGRGKTETDVKTINILDATISINEIAPYVHDVEVIHLSSDSVMIANISKLVPYWARPK